MATKGMLSEATGVGMARATWQWKKHAEAQRTAGGSSHVVINLDESFIGYYMTDKNGFVDRKIIHGTADILPPSHNLDLAKK